MLKPKAALLAFISTAALGSASVQAQTRPGSEASPRWWNGFYLGANLGYAWGINDWTVREIGSALPAASGSFSIFQPFDPFTEAGSYNGGLQAGYNFSLGHRDL